MTSASQRNIDRAQETGYLKTAAHDYVSRQAHVFGPRNVQMKGKCIIQPGVYVRGDFATVRLGRHCFIGEGTCLRPPSLPPMETAPSSSSKKTSSSISEKEKKPPTFLGMQIGANTRIGADCVVESASIGVGCVVGARCVIGARVLVRDHCIIQDDTVLPEDMVVPPFSVVAGCPGRITNDIVPESAVVDTVDESVRAYERFVQEEKKKGSF